MSQELSESEGTGSWHMLILVSANEAELIFWNKEDQRRVPVRSDPRRQECHILAVGQPKYKVVFHENNSTPFLWWNIVCKVLNLKALKCIAMGGLEIL